MEYSNTTLLVRHLPKDLTNQEKIDLLCHFGAESACPTGTKGPLKHAAFAKFKTKEMAKRGMMRLHQLEILGCKLVVEFAKHDHEDQLPTGTNDEKTPILIQRSGDVKKASVEKEKGVISNKEEDPFLVKHKIPYPRKTSLYYRYPPPTVSTLTNIANALASHPKLYTQVLHLMNKMNLPCPFGSVTPSPPLALDSHKVYEMRGHNENENFLEIDEVEMEDEESEIESDTDMPLSKESSISTKTKKRPRKRMRLVKPDMSMIIKPVHIPKPSEVFEKADERKSSQIVFNLTGGETLTEHKVNNEDTKENTSTMEITEGGFGKVEPVSKAEVQTEIDKPEVNYKLNTSNFLSAKTIAAGRLKSDQMKEFSVFKNYSRGETSCRLYIKNLTKQVSEQDLVDVFGGFIDWNLNNASDCFDIRLMKEGRMKGQCFVTLPDESSAVRIVDECNGYVLNNKPIVIQFARSARAKEVDKPVE